MLLFALVCACSPTHRAFNSAPSPTESPIRYSIPDCTVRYRVSASERLSAAGLGEHRGASTEDGIDTVIEFKARPRKVESEREWELLPVMTQYLRRGKYRPFAVPDSAYAAIELATDGRRWTEHEGSTMLFRAAGSLFGLVVLFPDLPDSNTVGATQDISP